MRSVMAGLSGLVVLQAAGLAWADGPVIVRDDCTITWQANSENDLAGYRLFADTQMISAKPLKQTLGLVTTTTCKAAGLAATADGQQWYVELAAVDTAGNISGRSAPAPFVLQLPPPPPPAPSLDERLATLEAAHEADLGRLSAHEAFQASIMRALCVTTRSTLRDAMRKQLNWNSQWCTP